MDSWWFLGGDLSVSRWFLGCFLVVSLWSLGGDLSVSRWFLGGFLVVSWMVSWMVSWLFPNSKRLGLLTLKAVGRHRVPGR